MKYSPHKTDPHLQHSNQVEIALYEVYLHIERTSLLEPEPLPTAAMALFVTTRAGMGRVVDRCRCRASCGVAVLREVEV